MSSLQSKQPGAARGVRNDRVAVSGKCPGLTTSSRHRCSCRKRFGSMDDCLFVDTTNIATGDSGFDDANGASTGGLSFSAPGAGNADSAKQSGPDGVRADDDLVPHAAGAFTGGSTGSGALSPRTTFRMGRDSERC